MFSADFDGITIVEDCLECRGLVVFKSLLKKLISNRVNKIILVNVEANSGRLLSHLADHDNKSNVLRSDTEEWRKLRSVVDPPILVVDRRLNDADVISSEIAEIITKELLNSIEIGIVFDSFTPWLLNQNVQDVDNLCKFINNVNTTTSTGIPVLGLVHSELLANQLCKKRLMTVANVWHKLDIRGNDPVCQSTERKQKGKIVSKYRKMSVNLEEVRFVDIRPNKESYVTTSAMSSSSTSTVKHPASDPLASVPFKLTLTDGEKNARDNVQLPYTEAQSEQGLVGIKGKCRFGGQIVYTPDEGDDLDDSDPDDDLNI